MPSKQSRQLTAKGVAKQIADGKLTFDNIIQRNYVWDKNRKSLFIHSLIMGWVPVPPFYCIKNGVVLDVIEGKQRFTTVDLFMKDEFVLHGVPTEDEDGEPFKTENGTVIGDINGRKFSELPEEFRDNIKDYSFDIKTFEEISSAQVAELFIRINNGKALTPTELAWVKTKCKQSILQIVANPIFAEILTENAINKYGDIKIAMFAWVALYQPIDEVSFESKKFRPLMATADITAEQVEEMTKIFDYLKNVRYIISAKDGDDSQKAFNEKVVKKISTQTHLLSILQVIRDSINGGISESVFADWCLHFYSGTTRPSVSEIYNDNAYQATNDNKAIKKRLNAVNLDYQTFVRGHRADETAEVVA